MKIINTPPPNFDAICDKFPVRLERGIVFAYAPDIYIPDGRPLPEWIIAHEQKHIEQQCDDPAKWWKAYIEDEAFRFDQELAAHRAEYRMVCRLTNDRETQAKFLSHIASKLIAPIYAYKDRPSISEARKLVKS